MTVDDALVSLEKLLRSGNYSGQELERQQWALDVSNALKDITHECRERGKDIQRFRDALPSSEGSGLEWRENILLACDTRRELMAAVDEHVPGWDPARNVTEVVGFLASERDEAKAERGKDMLRFYEARDALRAQVAEANQKRDWMAEEHIRMRQERNAALAATALVKADREGVWFWEKGGENGLESLTCPVVMEAETLRELLSTRPVVSPVNDASQSVRSLCADPYVEQVRRFHEAMGLPVRTVPDVGTPEERVLGVRLLLEEVLEYAAACAVRVLVHVGRGGVLHGASDLEFEPHDVNQPDLVAMTHELGDVQVIVSGRAVQFGLPILDAVTVEIHPANMRKLGPDGKPVRRADGKVVKPEGWQPANVARVVERALAGEMNHG